MVNGVMEDEYRVERGSRGWYGSIALFGGMLKEHAKVPVAIAA